VNPGIFRLQALLREFEAAQDHGEYVVEVVGHATGKLSDSLHLLRYRERVARALQRFLARRRSVTSRTILAKPMVSPRSFRTTRIRRLGPEAVAVLANAPAFACRLAFPLCVQKHGIRNSGVALLVRVKDGVVRPDDLVAVADQPARAEISSSPTRPSGSSMKMA